MIDDVAAWCRGYLSILAIWAVICTLASVMLLLAVHSALFGLPFRWEETMMSVMYFTIAQREPRP